MPDEQTPTKQNAELGKGSQAILQAMQSIQKAQPQEEKTEEAKKEETPKQEEKKETPKGPLADVIKGITGEKKQEPSDAQKEGSASDGADDDVDALLKIDPATLTTKHGAPVTEASRSQFKKLQSALSSKHEQFNKLKTELEELKKAPPVQQNDEEYKKIKEENERLKSELDAVAFTHSEEWKNTFDRPIDAESKKVNDYVKIIAPKLDDQKAAKLQSLLSEASNVLGVPDKEAEFDAIVDSITEEFITGTTGRKFSDAMQSLFRLTAKRDEASKDKSTAAKTITQKYAERSERGVKTLNDRLSIEATAFEKSPRGQILISQAEKLGYDGKKAVESASNELKEFLATGTVSPQLAQILHRGSLAKVHDTEIELLANNLILKHQAFEAMSKKVEELEERLLKLRGDGKSSAPVNTEAKGKSGVKLADRISAIVSGQ